MGKVVDITEKLTFDENPKLRIKGKELEVKLVLKKNEPGSGGGNLADISVDDLLQQNIHMDVTVENIEDDD